jgi:GTP diphosphokinase / guanosine-3',5'-bis(diphosphate) 3'-diphosphatase
VLRQYELVEKVKAYDPVADEAMINRAYVFSMKAHGGQKRASGDPYYSHPIEVAGILTDLRLDDETIVTAILHDTIEDTVATREEIKRLFGDGIARLVDGVTKLSKIEAQSESQRAAENLRKFLLAMSDDIRVLLVKLADRLHNMRTLGFISNPEKRRRIARETMDIYAPLAERIGMYEFMTEMQTLAFRELEPDAYESITKRLERLHKGGGDLIERIGRGLKAHLEANGIEAEVQGREKHPYSIWRKMAERHVSFEQLSDVMAFRAIVDSVEDCYRTLGLIHQRWPMVPGRFKDFISTPKRNGYRSLHTTIIHDEQMRIEIQIRTREMHARAEHGLAAHWAYKEGKLVAKTKHPWINDLVEILEHAATAEELLEHTRMAMYQDRIFAFTPKGELIQLPKGATPDGVLDLVVLSNSGRVTRVAPDTLSGSLGIALPSGSRGLQVRESDVSPEAVTRAGDTAIVSAALAPGEKQLTLEYQIPSGTNVVVLPLSARELSLNVLLEEPGARVEVAVARVDRDHRGLGEHDPAPADVDQRVRGPQIDRHIAAAESGQVAE